MRYRAWAGAFAAILGVLAGVLAPTSAALAQFYTPDEQPAAWNVNQKPATWDINLAAGAAMVPTYNGSDRYRVAPVPLVIIRYRDAVSLGADGLNLYWHHNELRIGGGVSYGSGRLDHETDGILAGGDNRLRGLGNIDSALGVRGFATYQIGPAYLDMSATKFVGSQNKGILVTLGAAAPLSLTKKLIARPHIGATWADGSYMRTFFGVTAAQSAASIFPAFSAGAGVENINGGLTIVYLLTDHWFMGADLSAMRYIEDAARSPITISNTNGTIGAVVGYHF